MMYRNSLLHIFLAVIIAGTVGYGQSVIFTATVEKDQYLVGEAVWVHLTLHNLSSDTLDYIAKTLLMTGLEIRNSSGKGLSPNSEFSVWVNEEAILLPGDSLVQYTDLSSHFGKYPDNVSFSVLPADIYTVNSTVEFRVKSSPQPSRLQVASNDVHFRVVKPAGDDIDVFDLLNQGYEAESRKDYILARSKFEQILQQYPTGPYLEYTYISLCLLFKYLLKDEGSQYLTYVKQFISTLPNAHYTVLAMTNLEFLYREHRDPEGFRRLLGDVISEHPNTVAANSALWRLNRMDIMGNDRWINYARLSKEERRSLGIK